MAIFDFNKPGGLLNLNPNDTGSLGINISPINEQKKLEEEQRARAEQSMKLKNFADTLRMVNANQSGNSQQSMMFANRLAQRKADQEARQLKAQKDMRRRNIYNNAPKNIQMIMDYEQSGISPQVINSLVSTPKDNSTSLMQNAQALATLRKRYSDMSEVEKESPEGKLLADYIQDFAGLGGALRYNPQTEFDKKRAAEEAKQGRDFGEGPLTTGQIATDKGFATFYKDYNSKGRGAKNVANVERLDDAKEIMKYAAKNGIAISSVPFSLVAQRPSLSAFFSPEGVMAQERVASVIQQSLKEILGGQFAEREGIALIQRGYNPALNPEENLERLLDLEAQVLQIVESEQDAVEYYENNKKSLAGYKGKRYTSDDFVRDLRKDYTMDVIDMSDQDIENAYLSAGDGSIWMETLEKEITRRADKKR
jgi:hypothetical protein